MKSEKFPQSPKRNTAALLWLAVMIIFAETIHAGPMTENPSGAVKSAGIEAAGGILRSVPPAWQPSIGNFLNSPTYSAVDLNKALLSLPKPTAQEMERTRLDDMARQQGFPDTEHLVQSKAAEFAKRLNNPTPAETVALTKKLAELNVVVGAYLPAKERERQSRLKERMERMAAALGRSSEIGMTSSEAATVDSSKPSIPFWQRVLPKSWRLQPSTKKTSLPETTPEVDTRQAPKMEAATSLKELENFSVGEFGLKLVQAMSADKFHTGNPFASLRTMAPIAHILQRGVTGFTRTIYRTTQNVRSWNSGYDFVRYDITHADGTRSIIDGFKKSRSPFDTMLGGADMRPDYQQILTSDGNGQMTGYLYENGVIQQHGTLSVTDGLAMADGFIRDSIKNRGLTKLERPNEIVYLPSK